MNPYELPALLADELPIIWDDIRPIPFDGNANNIVSAFTNYTAKMLALHDIPAVVKCMQIADKIYCKGNMLIKNVIESVFVFFFPRLKERSNTVEWCEIQAKIPITLFSVYIRQRAMLHPVHTPKSEKD